MRDDFIKWISLSEALDKIGVARSLVNYTAIRRHHANILSNGAGSYSNVSIRKDAQVVKGVNGSSVINAHYLDKRYGIFTRRVILSTAARIESEAGQVMHEPEPEVLVKKAMPRLARPAQAKVTKLTSEEKKYIQNSFAEEQADLIRYENEYDKASREYGLELLKQLKEKKKQERQEKLEQKEQFKQQKLDAKKQQAEQKQAKQQEKLRLIEERKQRKAEKQLQKETKYSFAEMHNKPELSINETVHWLFRHNRQTSPKIIEDEQGKLIIFLQNRIERGAVTHEGIAIKAMVIQQDAQITGVTNQLLGFLEKAYLQPLPDSKDFVRGKASCNLLGISGNNSNAVNSLLYDAWFNELMPSEYTARFYSQVGVGVMMTKEHFLKTITKEIVQQRKLQMEGEPTPDEAKDYELIKGSKLCLHFGLNGTVHNCKAANQLLKEYFEENTDSKKVYFRHVAGERYPGHFIRKDVIDSSPEIITKEKLICRAQEVYLDSLPEQIISFDEMIITLKGRADGTISSFQDRQDLADFLKSRPVLFDEEKFDIVTLRIDKSLMPLLRGSYLVPYPQGKDFVTGAEACEAIGTSKKNTYIVNDILRQKWLASPHEITGKDGEPQKASEVIGRFQKSTKTGVYASAEWLKANINAQDVKLHKVEKSQSV